MNYLLSLVSVFLLVTFPTVAFTAPAPVVVVNKGVGGNNTTQGRARFDRDVLAFHPQHLVIYFGINDAVNPGKLVPPDEYRANMQWMIDHARAAGIEHIVLITPHPIIELVVRQRHKEGYPYKESLNEHLLKYDAVVRELASKNHVDLADLRALVNKHGGSKATKDSMIRNPVNVQIADGVHFTSDGYRMMGELVAECFKGKIKPGQTVVCFGDSLTYGAGADGAGTSFGQTYPAVLNDLLNKEVGIDPHARAFPRPHDKPAKGKLLLNGGFEDTADGLTPYKWQLWNAKGKYEGTLRWMSQGAAEGGHFVEVNATDPKWIAYLMGPHFRLPDHTPRSITFQARGDGQVRLVINQYGGKRGRTFISPSKALQDAEKWQKVSNDWQSFTMDYAPSDDVTHLGVSFQVRGKVDLDDIAIRPADPSPKAATEPAASLKNDHIRVAFAPMDRGAGLVSIQAPNGTQFLRNDGSAPLWRIDLRRIPAPSTQPWKPELTYISFDPEQNDGAAPGTDDGGKMLQLRSDKLQAKTMRIVRRPHEIQFVWKGIDVGDEPGVLDVTVTAKLDQGDRFARFRTAIDNRSRQYTAFYVASPMVENVYPDGDVSQDHLASPVFNGRLIQDPIHNGILDQPRRFQPNRSGHSMQFDAYLHDGHGLYLGCFDGQQNAKRYEMTADAKAGFGWAIVHLPDNMKQVPQRWTTPYDTVIACFTGDWYDACRIYRQWALKQSWAAKGPLHTRKDIPDWFKNIDDWLMSGPTRDDRLDDPALVKAMQGLNIGAWTSYWSDFAIGSLSLKTPDRFPLPQSTLDYLAFTQSRDMPVMGYIQAICWDMDAGSFKSHDAIRHTVRNYDGKVVAWKLGRGETEHTCAIAWPGKLWTQVLGDTVEQMAKAGMRAAYLDSANHAGTYLMFNPLDNAGQCGGGNAYIKSNQNLIDAIRARARKIDPGFCFTAESFWEGNMAHLDAYLTCNTTNQPLDGTHITAIPMAQAVYHDHAIFYSAWVGKYDLEQDGGQSYFAKWGQALVWGVKPAWDQTQFLLTRTNHEAALADYSRRLHAYAASKPFLLEGTLLRQPGVVGKQAMVDDIGWYRGWSDRKYNVTMPAILRQAWRASDGRLGVVMYNLSDQPRTVTLALTSADHGVSANSATAHPVWPADARCSASWEGDHVALTATLPPHAPMVVAVP